MCPEVRTGKGAETPSAFPVGLTALRLARSRGEHGGDLFAASFAVRRSPVANVDVLGRPEVQAVGMPRHHWEPCRPHRIERRNALNRRHAGVSTPPSALRTCDTTIG